MVSHHKRAVLDNLELKVLEKVIRNPRITVSQLARELNISRQTARRKIDKINESGIIKGLFPVFNHEKVGGVPVLLVFSSNSEITEKLREVMTWEIYLTTNSMPNNFVLGRIFSIEDLKKLVTLLEQIDPKAEIRFILNLRTNFDTINITLASGIAEVRCEVCGEKIRGKPYTYTYRNITHFFCCPVCRESFVRKLTRARK
jgi:DNA-binding Lrp family transcriptional regulator